MTAEKIRVLTVDDHPLLRKGIEAMIQEERDIVLVEKPPMGRRLSRVTERINRM